MATADDRPAGGAAPPAARGRSLRVGIEACTWSNRRGYGRFTRELVARLIALHPQHRFALVIDRTTAEQSTFPAGADVVVVDTSEQPTQAASADGSRGLADIWRMSRALARGHYDVVLFPTRYTFVPLPGSTPAVLTIHDATDAARPELLFPDWGARLRWRLKSRLAIRRATRIVTVSMDAREQIAAAFGLDRAAIEVVSEGPDPVFTPRPDQASEAALRTAYAIPAGAPLLLYVGGISPHKNLQSLLHALARMERDGARAWHLVLVGDYQQDSFLGCHDELVALAARLALAGRVTFTGFVPDEDLAGLYNAATMLVLPSKGEGFGLPVVEAMACGLPVAASAANSLPEVLGGAGLLFDPDDPGAIAAAIRQLLDTPARRAELRARGLVRARDYSWDAGAATMMRVLESAAATR